jgi:hypothetical protein
VAATGEQEKGVRDERQNIFRYTDAKEEDVQNA